MVTALAFFRRLGQMGFLTLLRWETQAQAVHKNPY